MSERVVAQQQNIKTPQQIMSNAVNFQRQTVNHDEKTVLLEWQLATLSGGAFAELRLSHDFSGVPVFTGMARQNRPILRTQPKVQRSLKDGALDSSSCPTCPEVESKQIPATAEPAVESHAPATEATSIFVPSEPTTESAEPGETPASGLIVEDSATELASGQMKRSEFLSQLRAEICSTVEAAIKGTERTTDNCPYLNHWFDFYSQKESAHVERAIRRYAPEASNATTAKGYISAVTQRARQTAETWARTGEITGVPEGIPIGLPGTGLLGGLVSGIGSIFFKARNGGARAADDPQTIQAELGDGQPLDSGIRSRMESAFGMDFAHVRTHTDSTATELSNRFNARAFTVGEHVAFSANEYKPGTLTGDALLAHELAHVIQQGGAHDSIAPMNKDSFGNNALEEDADNSAIGAMVSLWSAAKKALTNFSEYTMPSLRSGLRLQRCGTTRTAATTSAAGAPSGTSGTPCPTSVGIGAIEERNHSNLSGSDKELYPTYLEATSRMDVGPGPDHSGHCMKERLTTVSNNCPEAAYLRRGRRTEPCTGDRCLGINQYAPRSFRGLTDSPTSFIDQHKTKIRNQSILEGTGVDSCTVVCEQRYTCDRIHPTTGTFQITRNYQAGTYTKSDGTTMHITTGTVTKTER